MTLLPLRLSAPVRSLGTAGLLAVLVGCGTSRTGGLPARASAPAVGAKAPAFALKDHKGEERTLDDFLKKGKAALVFYRSAQW
jgi:hypothetical protein